MKALRAHRGMVSPVFGNEEALVGSSRFSKIAPVGTKPAAPPPPPPPDARVSKLAELKQVMASTSAPPRSSWRRRLMHAAALVVCVCVARWAPSLPVQLVFASVAVVLIVAALPTRIWEILGRHVEPPY
jgi:hypothetical protein